MSFKQFVNSIPPTVIAQPQFEGVKSSGIVDNLRSFKPRNDTLQGGSLGGLSEQMSSLSVYSGSSITESTSDFLGDWRSADSWQRFDLFRVRNRSRQLERGNPWMQSFCVSLLNNVLGSNGFHRKINVTNSVAYGDTAEEGTKDVLANRIIADALKEFGKKENYTSKKKLSERACDRLLLQRLCFDGEIILQRRPNFKKNKFKFTWQVINPDYLDHNLNKTLPNGNIVKMGVELDGEDRFPVAYWFLLRRPNDYLYNYNQFTPQRYIRVEAKDVIHVFVQGFDDEQTRGWPWIFAACVNLFRLHKFEEAALVNAAIGASKMGFFKKTIPDAGFEPDPETDNGKIIDEVAPGTWTELPWNVEPVEFTPAFPSEQMGPFSKAMQLGISASLGISFMSLSNDYSDTNFSSIRPAQNEEREHWMSLQNFFIEEIKIPMHEETVYQLQLGGHIRLPLSGFDKFKTVDFTGRRWKYLQHVQDQQAQQIALDNCTTSISQIIREAGGEPEEVFREQAEDKKLMDSLGLKRVHSTFQYVDDEQEPQKDLRTQQKPSQRKPNANPEE